MPWPLIENPILRGRIYVKKRISSTIISLPLIFAALIVYVLIDGWIFYTFILKSAPMTPIHDPSLSINGIDTVKHGTFVIADI